MAKSLTPIGIEKLKPQQRRVEVPDPAVSGLYLVIQPSGVKSFALRYRHLGKTRKLTLGRYPKISLGEARTAAREALGHIERGNDPQKLHVAPDTFETAFTEFLDRYVSQNKSRYEVERQFKHDLLPAFGRSLISEISKKDVIHLIDAVADRGAKIMANRLLATLKKFFSWAVSRDLIHENPCLNLKLPSKETPRERILGHDEIRLFWHAAANLGSASDLSNAYERYFKFLLLCGQRRTEVAQMRWCEIDGEIWNIPAARSKNARSHTVPLTRQMKEVIGSNKQNAEAVVSNRGKHAINNISRAVTQLKKCMLQQADNRRLDEWKPHDLRRTVASEMARVGIYQEVIEKIQNRSGGKLGGVAGVYNRYNYAPEKLQAMERWHVELMKIIE